MDESANQNNLVAQNINPTEKKFHLSKLKIVLICLVILIPVILGIFSYFYSHSASQKQANLATDFTTQATKSQNNNAIEVEIKNLDTQISDLSIKLGSYPPNVKDDNELKQVDSKWQQAVDQGESLITEVPEKDKAYVYWQVGELYKLGHNLDKPQAFEKSEKNLLLAINADPNLIGAKLSLGTLYVNTSPTLAPKAEQVFQEALLQAKSEDELLQAYDGLFFANYYQGKFANAKLYLDKALQIRPNDEHFLSLKKILATKGY